MTDIELARRIIPLAQAAEQGKKFQYHCPPHLPDWSTCSLRDALFVTTNGVPGCGEVRIQPDPPERKEWWEVRVRQDGACIGEFDTFDEARDYLDKTPQRGLFKIVHAEEVW